MLRMALALLPLLLAGTVLAAASGVDPSFQAGWKAWHEQRLASLRRPQGWLALVGLHWLTEGENRIAGLPGVFVVAGRQARLVATEADGYRRDGQPVGSTALASDAAEKPDRLELGTRTVAVIDRSGKLALRVWDSASPVRTGFTGIDTWPASPSWRLVARWEAYPTPHTVKVPSVVGLATEEQAPGRAWFTVAGKEYALEPTLDGDSLFFVFRDATSPRESYGAGRFLVAPLPHDGKVTLDFNRAYNPPCAFSPHATCPLPLPENVLPVRIEAGEKKWSGGH